MALSPEELLQAVNASPDSFGRDYVNQRLLVEAIKQLGGTLKLDRDTWHSIILASNLGTITTFMDEDFDTQEMKIVMEWKEN